MKKLHSFVLSAMLAFVLPLSLGCTRGPAYSSPPGGATPVDGSFTSNGQRIYFTATSSSGDSITSEGFYMMHHRIACADCHGPEGKGGTVYMMMQRFEVPDITWPHLTEEQHVENGEHEEHPPYTEETVKRAVSQGLDPAGEPLQNFMPRWRMSEQDLDDLIDFMKTLE